MHPSDIATESTLKFVTDHLDARTRLRILEVGCGQGHLAQRLVALGHQVICVDPSDKAILACQQKGLDARKIDFLNFSDGTFDAVLFTRSLHHIHPLREVLKRTMEQLGPNGQLIIEDFDHAAMDRVTAEWFFELQARWHAEKRLTELPIPVSSAEPILSWRNDHDEHLSTGRQMIDTVREFFRGSVLTQGPYLYRYLIKRLPETEEAAGWIAEAFQLEEKLIALGSIRALGIRMSAKNG